MPNNRYITWFPLPASHFGLRRHRWAPELWGWLCEKIPGTRVMAAGLTQRLKAVTPDQWFLVGFVPSSWRFCSFSSPSRARLDGAVVRIES